MISIAEQTDRRFNNAFIGLFSLLFLIAPVYYQDNLGGEGLFLPYNNIVWLFTSFIIGLALLRILISQHFYLPSMTMAMLFFLACTTILGIMNSVATPVSWFFRSLAIWGGVLFFIALAQFSLPQRWRENLLYVVLISTMIQASYGIIHLLVTDSIPSWLPQSPGVPRGIFQQQNLNASYCASGFILAIFLITLPSYRSRNVVMRSMPFMALILTTVVLVTSGSRIGVLGLIAGTVIMLSCRYPQLWRRPRLCALIAIVVLGAGFAANQLPNKTGGLDSGIKKFNTVVGGGDVRLMIYDSSWELFKEKPLLGYGIGQFQRVWHDKKITYLQQHPDAGVLKPRLSHPHNEFLYWAIEGGLAALAGILAIISAFLWSCWKIGWRRGGSYVALIIPIAFHTQVELPFYISQLHWILFITLIAIVASHQTKTLPVRISSMARVTGLSLAIAVPVLSAVFVGHSLASINTTIRFLTAKDKDLSKLEYPSKNLYFNRHATLLQMQALVNIGIKTDNKEMLESYIPMAKAHLRYSPDANVFNSLAFAFHQLKKYNESHQVLARSLAMYPTTRAALIGRDTIMKMDKEAGIFDTYWKQQTSP